MIRLKTLLKEHNYRSLSDIAQEIRRDWKNISYSAKPYLGAMSGLDSVNDSYGADDGFTVVSYFLANAGTWKGDVAKRIKAELNAMLKGKPVPVKK